MTTQTHPYLRVSLGFILALAGCSDEAQFHGAPRLASEDATVEPPAPVDINEVAEFALTWRMECQKSLALASSQGNGKNQNNRYDDKNDSRSSKDLGEIAGNGDHGVEMDNNDYLALNIEGTLCGPESQDREIVFVIDVSGSMRDNDPMVSGSCGRAKAVAAIVNNLSQATNTRIGLVTFGTGVTQSTGTLMQHADFIQSTYFSEAVLCEANGNTNYKSALGQAIALLTGSRPSSLREVYFISDGFPGFGQEGLQEAAILKDPNGINATIATMMLEGNDTALKQISSSDSSGLPMHAKTSSASQLVNIIQDLARTEIVETKLRYRATGSVEWTEIDLGDHVTDLNFAFQIDGISMADYPNGMQIEMEYVDNRGKSTIDTGRLVWTGVTESQRGTSQGTANASSGKDKSNKDADKYKKTKL